MRKTVQPKKQPVRFMSIDTWAEGLRYALTLGYWDRCKTGNRRPLTSSYGLLDNSILGIMSFHLVIDASYLPMIQSAYDAGWHHADKLMGLEVIPDKAKAEAEWREMLRELQGGKKLLREQS